MRLCSRSLTFLIMGCGLLGLSSCQSPPSSPSPSKDPSAIVPSNSPSQPARPLTPPPIEQSLTTVTIYTVDSQCNQLIPQTVTVPAKNSLEATVGKVLDEQASPDFEIQGYRLTVDANLQAATIDLRRPPQAKRSFASLSTCEQLALFGSLNKTIVANPQWQIKTVRFLDSGQDIMF